MTRLILALFASVLGITPALAVERGYSVTDFERIQIEGPYEVVLASGLPTRAVSEGSQYGLDRVSLEVRNRTLYIRPNRSRWGGAPDRSPAPVRIRLAAREISSAAVSGSGSLAIDKLKGLRINLAVSGSGRLKVGNVDADVMSVMLTGSGNITLAGKAKQLRATVTGTGDLDATMLRADDAQIQANSSGEIAAAAVRTAKVVATGLGSVIISGRPACTVSGPAAGQVACGR